MSDDLHSADWLAISWEIYIINILTSSNFLCFSVAQIINQHSNGSVRDFLVSRIIYCDISHESIVSNGTSFCRLRILSLLLSILKIDQFAVT